MKAASFFIIGFFFIQSLLIAHTTPGVIPIAIIGGGPAGLTASLYAARFGIACVLFEGDQPGGQLVYSSEVENYPGFFPYSAGKDLVALMRSQALDAGAKIRNDWVKKIDVGARPFEIHLASGQIERAWSVILAMGAKPRQLGLASEKKFWGRGVSSCALCDGPLYYDLDVVVVGGGDAAFDEALMLSKIAKRVTLVHRSEQLKASQYLQDQVKKCANVEIRLNEIVEEILGTEEAVTGIHLRNQKTQQQSQMACHGVFIAIGQEPDTQGLPEEIKKDRYGYIMLKAATSETSVEGVFAAGDICDPKYRQAITAAASGCRASIEVREYLNRMNLNSVDHEVEE